MGGGRGRMRGPLSPERRRRRRLTYWGGVFWVFVLAPPATVAVIEPSGQRIPFVLATVLGVVVFLWWHGWLPEG